MATGTLHSLTRAAGLVAAALVLLSTSAFAQADGGRAVTWNTYLGGDLAGGSTTAPGNDELEAVVTARDGEVFVTGKTNAASFPKTLDGARGAGDSDVVITRISSGGQVVWSRVIGGAGEDVGKRMTFTDSIENRLLVAGTTTSPTLRNPNFPVSGTFVAPKTAFLAQVELDGRIAWFRYLDSTGHDEAHDVSVVPSAQLAYVVGEASGDAFVTKLSIAGASPSILWTKRFGTEGAVDVAYAVVSHHQFTTLLYVAGRTGLVKASDTSVVQPENVYGDGESDGFIARIDPNSQAMVWFRYLGGGGTDEVRALVLNEPLSTLTILGNTHSSNYPPQGGRGGNNIFLARLLSTGGIVGQERLVGSGGETLQGHASTDSLGNIYFGGSTVSSNTLARNAFDSAFEPGDDGFVAMVDKDLQRIAWASYVGGPSSSNESVRGVSSVPIGQLTFVGNTSAGSGVLVTNSGEYRMASGGTDGVVFRMPVDEKPPTAGTVEGRFNANNQVVATWSGFQDDETDISYEVSLVEGGNVVQTEAAPYNATTYTFNHVTNPEREYRVRVRATDLFGHPVDKLSEPVVRDPPDAGTSDGGSDGDPNTPEDGDGTASPLGWECGSTGGGSLLGVVALMGLALLLRSRAARR